MAFVKALDLLVMLPFPPVHSLRRLPVLITLVSCVESSALMMSFHVETADFAAHTSVDTELSAPSSTQLHSFHTVYEITACFTRV